MGLFDNCRIEDVPAALNKDSLLERYYALIPVGAGLCAALVSAGIRESDAFLSAMDEPGGPEKLRDATGYDADILLQGAGSLARVFTGSRTCLC